MKTFETQAALALASLVAGQLVETKGQTTAGDGGEATYLIVAGASPEPVGSPDLVNAVYAARQPAIEVIAAAATVIPDALTASVKQITLSENLTIDAPTTPLLNKTIRFFLIQDGTGGFTTTWNATFNFTTAWSDAGNVAAAKSMVEFVYDGVSWRQTITQSTYA